MLRNVEYNTFKAGYIARFYLSGKTVHDEGAAEHGKQSIGCSSG
ncbi:hypothetical protein [Endozoicomonas montiporae]|nr:hypothetical protein [Endozoicomonas montiporae]